MIVAIDGPAGSGKSTVAKLVAKELGFAYLDTGAMYRAVAYLALDTGVDLDDGLALTDLANSSPIRFGYLPGEALPSEVFISNRDVTHKIRTPEVDAVASKVSTVPGVRHALVAEQRVIGAQQDTVMEGRDIGTVVFPHAELKVFLTARPEVRAQRRLDQNAEKADEGVAPLRHEEVLAQIIERDKQDSERETSPLAVAEGALVLDTSDMSIDEVVEWIAHRARTAH